MLPGTDIVILTLSNGARVYYKVNDDGRNILYFGAVSPGGTNMLDDDVLFVHELSMNSYDKTPMDLLRINMDVDASIYLDPQREGMYGTGPADNLKAIFPLFVLTTHRRTGIAKRLERIQKRLYELYRHIQRQARNKVLEDPDAGYSWQSKSLI